MRETTQDNVLIAIGRLEGKVEALINMIQAHSSVLEEYDDRIRELEQGKAWLLGIAACLGTLCGFISKFIGG